MLDWLPVLVLWRFRQPQRKLALPEIEFWQIDCWPVRSVRPRGLTASLLAKASRRRASQTYLRLRQVFLLTSRRLHPFQESGSPLATCLDRVRGLRGPKPQGMRL